MVPLMCLSATAGHQETKDKLTLVAGSDEKPQIIKPCSQSLCYLLALFCVLVLEPVSVYNHDVGLKGEQSIAFQSDRDDCFIRRRHNTTCC